MLGVDELVRGNDGRLQREQHTIGLSSNALALHALKAQFHQTARPRRGVAGAAHRCANRHEAAALVRHALLTVMAGAR